MKTALVTGYTGGIGSAVVQRLLGRDFSVIGLGRNSWDGPVPTGLSEIECDLADLVAVEAIADELPEVDLLINNAGVMLTVPYDNYPIESMRLSLAVNLQAPVALMTTLGRRMAERGSGRIVNTASLAGHIGHPDVWYGMTKAGIINATKSFAVQLGPRGVQVNAVAPGPVMTPMLDSIPIDRQAAVKSKVFTGRFATPQEVAETIVWLAIDAPDYINGACIDINDGAYLR